MESPDIVAVAGTPGQGRHLVLYIRLEGSHVANAKFECNGCGVTIACASALTELITGKSIPDCESLTTDDLVLALDGVPSDRRDCPEFAMHALRQAISEIKSKHDF